MRIRRSARRPACCPARSCLFADPQQDIAVKQTGIAVRHQSRSRYRVSREKASSGSTGILCENCASFIRRERRPPPQAGLRHRRRWQRHGPQIESTPRLIVEFGTEHADRFRYGGNFDESSIHRDPDSPRPGPPTHDPASDVEAARGDQGKGYYNASFTSGSIR